MTVKENKPTKLFYTDRIFHKAAIFCLIMDYKPTDIHYFLDSLACTGYNATLIILYNNLDKSTKKYIISFSDYFEIVMIPIQLHPDIHGHLNYISDYTLIRFYRHRNVTKRIEGNTFQKVELLQLNFECGDFRFEIAYFLNENHFFDPYDLLFFSDVGDVLFQLDLRKFNYTDGAYVTEEAGVSIEESHYWLDMYDADITAFQKKCELCVGTMILVGKKSFNFLNGLHNQIKDHLETVVQRPNFQGTLNFLVYNNSYGYPDGFVRYLTTRHGIVNSVAKLNGHMANFNKNRLFNRVGGIFDIYLHDGDFQLYNQDFQKLAVVHHTKYVPATKEKTFVGAMRACRRRSPELFEKIVRELEERGGRHEYQV